MEFTSQAFASGAPIPGKYTCTGDDLSPPLRWSNLPDGVRSYALILDDPDAPSGVFTHWVLYNIPGDIEELEEGFALGRHADWRAESGRNDFGATGYGGPCPPVGEEHHYYFRLFALDTELGIGPGANRNQVLDAVRGHILDHAELMGTYQRARSR